MLSRKVVGWSMAQSSAHELVLDALEMAIGQRRRTAYPSQRPGSQYTSRNSAHVQGSRCAAVDGIGRRAYDNASARASRDRELRVGETSPALRPAEAKIVAFTLIEGGTTRVPTHLHSDTARHWPDRREVQTRKRNSTKVPALTRKPGTQSLELALCSESRLLAKLAVHAVVIAPTNTRLMDNAQEGATAETGVS